MNVNLLKATAFYFALLTFNFFPTLYTGFSYCCLTLVIFSVLVALLDLLPTYYMYSYLKTGSEDFLLRCALLSGFTTCFIWIMDTVLLYVVYVPLPNCETHLITYVSSNITLTITVH